METEAPESQELPEKSYDVFFTFTAMGKTIEVPNSNNPVVGNLNEVLSSVVVDMPAVAGLLPTGVRVIDSSLEAEEIVRVEDDYDDDDDDEFDDDDDDDEGVWDEDEDEDD